MQSTFLTKLQPFRILQFKIFLLMMSTAVGEDQGQFFIVLKTLTRYNPPSLFHIDGDFFSNVDTSFYKFCKYPRKYPFSYLSFIFFKILFKKFLFLKFKIFYLQLFDCIFIFFFSKMYGTFNRPFLKINLFPPFCVSDIILSKNWLYFKLYYISIALLEMR